MASTARQVLSAFLIRSTMGDESVVSVPSRLAVVWLPPVVMESTTTGFPVLFAFAWAARIASVRAERESGCPSAGGVGHDASAGPWLRSAGAAAATPGAASSPAPREKTAVQASGRRATRNVRIPAGRREKDGDGGSDLDMKTPSSLVM
ncbi:hypothetical protein [Kitasatospora sp. NPDC001132]